MHPIHMVCIAVASSREGEACLLLLQGDATDEEEQAHEEQRGDYADPVASAQHRYAQQPQAPPLQDLAAIVWISGILPGTCIGQRECSAILTAPVNDPWTQAAGFPAK